MLRDPRLKLDELTLNTASDIDLRFSDFRREQAQQRAPCLTGWGAGMPHTVLECVVEEMANHFCPFPKELVIEDFDEHLTEDNRRKKLERRAPLDDLLRMSLVHRSCTAVIQRVIRRRVVLRSEEWLRRFVHSALCGPWVTEFAYIQPENEGRLHFLPEDDSLYDEEAGDVFDAAVDDKFGRNSVERRSITDLLVSVIARVPNLRRLMLYFEQGPLGFNRCLQDLRGRHSLHALWLHNDDPNLSYSLYELCIILPSLRSLSFKSLRGWQTRERSSDDMIATRLQPF